MNRAACYLDLRYRGYPGTLAALAVDRAGQDGEYGLARHKVTASGDGEFRIVPVPWPDGGPRPADIGQPPAALPLSPEPGITGQDERDGGLFTLKPGNLMTISWSGELRTVTCDRIENGGAVIRDLTDEEQDDLDEQAYQEFRLRCGETP